MDIYEAIYKDGSLKLVGAPKIEADVVKVKILNRDQILTEKDTKDILDALKEKSGGKLFSSFFFLPKQRNKSRNYLPPLRRK